MPSASTVAELAVVVTADTTAAEKGLSDLGTKAGSAGSAIASAFTGAAVAGAVGLAAGIGASVAAAADFEKTMSGVKAVSGATSDEMATLTAKALQLGKDTSFSASEAAAGMEELVKGGLTIPDIMNGAAEATLNLAAAGGVSLPDAATIAANALAQFNLKGEDMAHVADLIAGAANASALDVGQFKYSLQAAGAVASTVGFSFDDLAEGIAIMGKAGITGSDAGTSLKTMMLNLQPATNAQRDEFRRLGLETNNLEQGLAGVRKLGIEPLTNDWPGLNRAMSDSLGLSADVAKWTNKDHDAFDKLSQQVGATGSAFFDANGKVKSMADVAQVLQTAMTGMTEAQRLASLEVLFGSDAIRAGAVLAKEGAAGFDAMAESMGKVTAKEVGAEKLNNLMGSIEQLKGSLETMGITIGLQLLPILKDFVDALTAAANEAMPAMEQAAKDVAAVLKDWAPTLKAAAQFLWDNRDAVVAVVAALATFAILTTVVGWVTAIASGIAAVTAAIGAAGGVMAALGALLALLGGPVTLIIAAVALAVAALAYAWANNWGDIQGTTEAVVEFLSGVPDAVAGFFDAIGTAADDLVTTVTDAWAAIATATTTVWDGITGFLTDWWRAILITLTGPVGLVAVLVIDHWEAIKTATETIFAAVANILTAVWDLIYDTIIKPKLDAIGLAVSTTWEAIRAAIEEKITAAQTVLATTWAAIATTTTETLNAFLAFVRDTIFEPLRVAVAERILAVQTAVETAWQAVSDTAHAILDPVLAYIRDTIFTPIETAAETAMTAVSTAFSDSVGAVKTTVETTMDGVKNAWETMWAAIEHAASSPAAALETVTTAVKALKDAMPDWLIPHSPTPFEMGIRGIADAVKRMQDRMTSFSSGMGDVPGELQDWIDAAIAVTGASKSWASGLAWIAMHESGGKPHAVNPEAVGNEHASGVMQTLPSTFRAYAEPGMHEIFNPVHNIAAAINYIEDAYVRGRGRDLNWIIENWASRGGYAAGGWAGLHGPELAWLGERGPEYVVPNAALRGGGARSEQAVRIDVAIGGRVAEQIVVEGYELAIRRGRLGGLAGSPAVVGT